MVTRDGHLLETEGSWKVEGRVVVYRQPWAKMLVSLPLDEVDLERSQSVSGSSEKVTVSSLAGEESADSNRTPRTLVTTLSPERRRLVENIDDERPSRQRSILVFNRPLTIGGSLKLGTGYSDGRELAEEELDAEADQQRTFRLEFLYSPSKSVTLFTEAVVDSEAELYHEDGEVTTSELAVKRGLTWLHWAPSKSNASFQLGRQSFQEPRQWWWSRALDAARVRYRSKRVKAEIGIAQELAPVDLYDGIIRGADEDLLRVLGSISGRYARRHSIGLFFLDQSDNSQTETVDDLVERDRRDPVDADLTWLGLRLQGTRKLEGNGAITYWLDGAWVGGEETNLGLVNLDSLTQTVSRVDRYSVEGWAVDSSLTWESRLPMRPAFTLGYARGSADTDPGSDLDRSFRQTGLHRNKVKYAGEESFRIYGEILDPELSNIEVGTLVLGFPLLRSSSVDFAAHLYRQLIASPYVRGGRLKVDPLGEETDLGTALDLVFALEEWEHWRVRLIGSAFRAGPAYGELEGQMVYESDFKISIVF